MEGFRVNQNRCINHFRNIKCNLCEKFCPQAAISCDNIIEMNCNGCGLCLSVCPVGAIESMIPYQEEIIRNLANDLVVLKCQKQEKDNPIPCLGFLDSRILWAMAQNHQVILDLNHCRNCNLFISQTLHDRISQCNNVLQRAGKPFIDESNIINGHPVTTPEKKINRKDFFKQLMGVAFVAVEALDKENSQNVYSSYQSETYINQQFHPLSCLQNNPLFLTFQKKCTCNACGLCAKLCPQQALQGEIVDEKFHLTYKMTLCYHCAVCEKNCPQKAIHIVTASDLDKASSEWSIPLPVCHVCHQHFQPIGSNKICLTCFQKSNY